MTTSVIVKAHCAAEKEVVIRTIGNNTKDVVINDGDVHEVVVYDNLQVQVEERFKN